MQRQSTQQSFGDELEASYGLAPMQQGMLFHSVSASQPGVYVQQLVCSLREALQLPLFIQAWEQVIERHAILRTSFRWEGLNVPFQEVRRQAALHWELHDWQALAEHEQQRRFNTALQEDRQRGFDLAAAPLMRVALFRLAEDDYRCVWTYHHALLDGRSRLILIKEVFARYDAACQGEEIALPEPRPYQDYIEWLQQQNAAQLEEFWRTTLRGFTAPTPFRIDHPPPPPTEPHQGNHEQELLLSSALTASLRHFARDNQLTLNTLLQGVWALLLHHYSGEEEVVFGATRACRRSALDGKTDTMVGLFINTLPIRVQVTGEHLLLPWLRDLRTHQIALRDYEHTPLSKIHEWSSVPPGTPLFESLMIFENHRVVDASVRDPSGAWAKRSFELREQTSYPLTFSGYDGSELQLTIEYDRGRFSDATINRMLGHLRTMLEAIAANPHQRLADIPLLTETEQRQLLVEWNDTNRPYPQNACIHHLFEAQARRTPEAIAIEHQAQRLTYAELDRRANQLAHYLRARGVQPGTLTGLCLERSVEMMVGVLGVLKAGGAYVPLDPTSPKERLKFILEDAQASVVVTQHSLLEMLPDHIPHRIALDTDGSLIDQEIATAPTHESTAAHPAYVIYTSGSTGTPKGVLIPHHAVVNHCTAMLEHFALHAQDRVLQFACLNFDASVEELFPTWACGAALITRPPDMLGSTLDFLRLVEQMRISVLNLPTAFWHELVHGLTLTNVRLPSCVRLVIVGGEKASASAFAAWSQLEGNRSRWLNTYGPTEATITTTVYEPVSDLSAWSPTLDIPIGRPLANTQVYILDQARRPVPIGVPGELYIGGAGLALGYLHNPQLTAEKFVSHPFTPEPDARLYKTGDRARYLADGNLEFLGRVDHQVKLRGLRIELGEIEAVLTQHPAIHDAVVLVREDNTKERRLVGYLIPQGQQAPTTVELYDFLKERLPAYMAPASLVMLDAFPLTSTGKVDRRALPAPERSVAQPQDAVGPRDEQERLLVKVWEELFPGQPISVQANFFALGGHSLLAIRMLSKVQQLTGKRLPLASLLKEGSIEQLARLLRHNPQQSPSCLVEIQPKGANPPFFCVHGAGGGVFWYHDLAKQLGRDQPFYGIESPGIEDPTAMQVSIETLAVQYLEAIRTRQPHGPYFLGGYSMGGLIAFEMARQLRARGQQVALLAVFDTWGPGSQPDFPERLQRLAQRFWRMPLRDKVSFLQAKARWLSQSLQEWRQTGILNRHVWRLQRLKNANINAVHAYQSQIYAGVLTLFRAQRQRTTASFDPYLGWRPLVTGAIEVYEIPGDHYTMFALPQACVLAERLQQCLTNAQRNENVTERQEKVAM